MWWAIGIVSAVFAFFLFSKFQAASRHLQLVSAAQNQLRVSFLRYNVLDRKIDDRVWHDPYLLGFAQGSIAILTALFGGKLSTVQRGMVTVDALKGLIGSEYGLVCERSTSLQASQDPEFKRGLDHGVKVALLMSNRPTPELLSDSDVQIALRNAPADAAFASAIFGDEKSDAGPYGAAGGALLTLYLDAHKLR